MTRLACLLLFSGIAVAAPVPKDAGKDVIYFPTTVGAKWVYEGADGETEEVEVYEVEKDRDGLVVGRRRVGQTMPYTKMIVSAEGCASRRTAASRTAGCSSRRSSRVSRGRSPAGASAPPTARKR